LVNPTNNNGGNGSFHVVFGSRQNKGPGELLGGLLITCSDPDRTAAAGTV
jgi:hypothetical protein